MVKVDTYKVESSSSLKTMITRTARKRRNSDLVSDKTIDLDVSSTSENAAKKVKQESKLSMVASLECPVCLEVPRAGAGPIFGCKNGHLLCQGCVDKIEECPICREKEIRCRNLFAERYIETEFKDVPFKCKFVGCGVKLPMTDGELIKHEKFCPHREVPCPSSHRHACTWCGPLSNLIKHMKEKKCVQVIFDDNWKKVSNPQMESTPIFRSNLGDFPKEAVSVFERSNVITHWKPVVLLAKGILNIWCYVLVQRDSAGVWNFMLYSMLPKDCLEGITAKLTIASHTDTRKYTFETKVLSFQTTKDEAIKMGQYMCLQDAQVKPFQTGNEKTNTLFNYVVEVQADPEFLAEMNKSACVSGRGTSANTPNANSTKIEDQDKSIIEVKFEDKPNTSIQFF